MALASLGARTPFITSTPSKAVTLASLAVTARLGLAAAGDGSALLVATAALLSGLASELPAMTGNAVMASKSKLDDNLLTVNMDVLSSKTLTWGCLGNMGRNHSPYVVFVKSLVKSGYPRASDVYSL
jgi:hypothetical protein